MKTRSIRSYQREIKRLKDLITEIQWVQPSYNGSPSCSCCGNQQHHGCNSECSVAAITKNYGSVDL